MKTFFILLPLLYLAGNVYIFIRGLQALGAAPIGIKIALSLIYWLGCLSFFGSFGIRAFACPVALARVASLVGTGWLVFTLYMTIALVAVDLLRVFHLPCKQGFISSLILIICLLGYGYFHYKHPGTKVINRVINKQVDNGPDKLRIVAVSDVHLGYATNRKALEGYVRRINELRPDLVLIGGDLIDSNVTPLRQQRMDEELARINAPMGIYMVPGNHEYISGIEESARFIAQTPVVLLRDSVVRLPNGVQIAGRDDRSNRRRLPAERLIASTDPNRPVIVLDHQPYEPARIAEAGADLQFSGHTHHGQVWPLNWLTDRLFEVSYGEKTYGDRLAYVSSGLSLWGPPFRIGTDSEIVVFELTFKKQQGV